jgi:hypothetical protein
MEKQDQDSKRVCNPRTEGQFQFQGITLRPMPLFFNDDDSPAQQYYVPDPDTPKDFVYIACRSSRARVVGDCRMGTDYLNP